MAVFEYTAKDRVDNRICGTYRDVDSVAILREELEKMGYVLLKSRRVKEQKEKRKAVKQSEVVTFAYRFSGMYAAGLPIIRCLETLEEQTENQAFKSIIADIRKNVETGSSLRKAFGKYRDVFSDFFVGMIEAGEGGGKLAASLEMIAAYLEKSIDMRRKVKAAFAYPIAVIITCLVVVTCLLVFVIPIFSKIYAQLHVSLPGPTLILVKLSVLVRGWWWAMLIVGTGAAVALRWILARPQVRAKWDVFKLNMPIFGKLNRMIVTSNFTRTFAMLASVGVPLVEALEVGGIVAHNSRMTEVTRELREAIEGGNPVAAALQKHDIFPPIIVQLAISGEEAGKLPEMLGKGAEFLDKDIERVTKSLLTKLEPVLTIAMGIIVGFLLMSVYLPMFDYIGQLK